MESIIKKVIEFFYIFNGSEVVSALSNWQFIIVFISSIVLILLCGFSLAKFTKKTDNYTKDILEIFRDSGKYIDGLFVEIDDKKELLRYFLFENKFKSKIIQEHNRFVNNRYFTDIGKKINYRFVVNRLSTKNGIIKKINKNKAIIESNSPEKNSKDINFAFFVDKIKYGYNVEYDNINRKLKITSENSIILIGNAGNGKTTLMCNMAQTLLRKKYPCIYINSKEVTGNLTKYFVDILPIFKKLKQDNATMFFRVVNLLLYFKRKHFVILVDALNENDDETFIQSINEFNKYIVGFSRFKVMYSCRKEYYNIRSKKYFPDNNKKPFEIVIDDNNKTHRATEKIFNIYRQYYNYSGNVREDSKNKMLNSLLLMRMFFEVNVNSSNDTSQLYNHRIFRQYIKKVNEANSEIQLSVILDKLSDLMIENKQYGEINITLLDLSKSLLDSILDNNLILSKRITKHSGEIHETEETLIYFTFDEIRDYYLSRRIIQRCGEKMNFDFLFQTCDYLYENKISAIEGVLKYTYFHLMENRSYDVAKEILYKYYNYSNNDYYYEFNNDMEYYILGVNIVMECPRKSFLDFEKNFIFSIMNSYTGIFIKLFNNLLKNEICGYQPNLDIFIEGILFEKTNIKKIISHFEQEYVDKDYYIRRNYEKFETLITYLDEHSENLYDNKNIIKLFILLSILFPYKDYFFAKVVNNQFTYNLIIELLNDNKNEELNNKLFDLKNTIENYNENIIDLFNPNLKKFLGL